MRLISLKANKPTFKIISFKETGASFILAKQKNPNQSDNNKTYNGVGKSLLISLIHFCLGASTSNKITKSLKTTLHDWHFILEVKIENQLYTIMRKTNDPSNMYLDGTQIKLDNFCLKFQKLCFEIPDNLQYLSFRSLLPFFIRPSKHSYINYNEPTKIRQPYQGNLYNAFLLGLDVTFAEKKMLLKKEIDETQKQHKNIKNDPILKQFFEGYKDSSLALADLDEKIKKLESDLKKFEIADDYYDIKQKSDEIKKNLDTTQNEIKLKEINIENIDQSLDISPDVNRDDMQKIYEESKLVFQLNITKKLEQLDTFYQNLTANRTKRLQLQKREILNELEVLETAFDKQKKNLDDNMKFLNAHQSLDIFTKTSSYLAELQQNKEKLLGYEKLQYEYEHKKRSLTQLMLSQSQETTVYLKQAKEDINKIMEYFRQLVKLFYSDALAGITVRNNDGPNKIRYDIEAKIQSDSSDGINNVKIFCYDLTILMQRFNHRIDFLFHDSRLFSKIDETHCNELFKVIKDKFTNKQYIATINENQFNNLSEDMKKFVKERTIKELTDNSDEGKLLGITVELEYD